ncbi:MAG: hypothetical protein Q7T51_01040 [Candidatus Moranbacteria bacterium]|nr:hypothetical protein [Candidatus Moranbacteria bacterium]
MTNILAIQVVAAFVVGGAVIALLTFMAERASSRTAGIILSFPSTIALGYFFLGWTVSPEAVARIVPSTLVALGAIIVFAIVYVNVAERNMKLHKIMQIGVSLVASSVVWLAIVSPVVYFKVSSLLIGIVGYAVLICVGQLLISRKLHCVESSLPAVKYTFGQKIGRAVFIGFIVALIVLLSKTVSPFWGGVFSVFPAALSSALIVFHWHYGAERLHAMIRKVAIGSITLFTYAIVARIVFPQFGFVWGTLMAYVASFCITRVVIGLQKK